MIRERPRPGVAHGEADVRARRNRHALRLRGDDRRLADGQRHGRARDRAEVVRDHHAVKTEFVRLHVEHGERRRNRAGQVRVVEPPLIRQGRAAHGGDGEARVRTLQHGGGLRCEDDLRGHSAARRQFKLRVRVTHRLIAAAELAGPLVMEVPAPARHGQGE